MLVIFPISIATIHRGNFTARITLICKNKWNSTHSYARTFATKIVNFTFSLYQSRKNVSEEKTFQFHCICGIFLIDILSTHRPRVQCCCGRCLFGNVDGNRRGEGRRLQLFVLLHLQHLRRANMKQKWKVFQWLKQKVFLINVKKKKWEKQLWNITNANNDERKSDKYKISDGERWVKINVKLHGLCLWSGGLVGHNETSSQQTIVIFVVGGKIYSAQIWQ